MNDNDAVEPPAETPASIGDASHGARVEPDRPPARAILVTLAVLTLTILLAGVGLSQLFGLTSIAELEVKDLKVDDQELLELRARDWGRLTQYEVLDAGVYQLPIERAMDKLVARPSLIAPLASAATSGSAAASEDRAPAGAAPESAATARASSEVVP